MGDMAISVIWFASIIAGMVLTLLLLVVFSDSYVREATQDERARVPSQDNLPMEAENLHS